MITETTLMNLDKLAQEYLEEKKYTWSETTYKSEAARMNKIVPLLVESRFDPFVAFKEASKLWKPYTIKTLFMRASNFEQWLIDNEHLDLEGREPRFRRFLRGRDRHFKKAYQKGQIGITYETAVNKINRIKGSTKEETKSFKKVAKALLNSGLRWCETGNVSEDGCVLGKGGRVRRSFLSQEEKETLQLLSGLHKGSEKAQKATRGGVVNYHRFWRSLRRVGLTPHMLRKLAASRFAEVLNPQELLKVMGWTNIHTATLYMQTRDDRYLAEKLKGVQNA